MNYISISLLEIPGKLYEERFVQERLNAYLNDNNIIKDGQHGFRSNKGTTTATVTYENKANGLSEKNRLYPTWCGILY